MPDKIKTLRLIAERLDPLDIDWAVIGKMNLALQGIPVTPSKIGILVRHNDKGRVLTAFEDTPVLDSFALSNGEGEEEIRSVNGSKVQFCFEFEHGFYMKYLNEDSPVRIRIGTRDIPCLRLEHEAKAYEYLNEPEMAESIWEYLSAENSLPR